MPYLLEDLILLPAPALLHLPLAGLLSLADPALPLRQHGEGVDAALLLQADQLLAQEVQHISQTAPLQRAQTFVDEGLLRENMEAGSWKCYLN